MTIFDDNLYTECEVESTLMRLSDHNQLEPYDNNINITIPTPDPYQDSTESILNLPVLKKKVMISRNSRLCRVKLTLQHLFFSKKNGKQL